MGATVTIRAAVEGISDEAIARRLIQHVGATPGQAYGHHGKSHLRKKIGGYNNAARLTPWFVLVDLDQEADCPPPMRSAWVPAPAPKLCFRIAVHATEAWLIADAESVASFLGVSRARVPDDPDAIAKPKQAFVNLARQSGRRAIRDDMVPHPDSGRAVGPAYTARVIEFVSKHWRPEKAAAASDSLRRAIACLKHLIANA